MSLETVRNSFHAQFLNCRNVDVILRGDDFAIAYLNATKREQEEVRKVIERADKVSIKKFTVGQLVKLSAFHQMSIRKLREIGRNVRIKEYYMLNKATLIEEIQDVVTRLKEGSE